MKNISIGLLFLAVFSLLTCPLLSADVLFKESDIDTISPTPLTGIKGAQEAHATLIGAANFGKFASVKTPSARLIYRYEDGQWAPLKIDRPLSSDSYPVLYQPYQGEETQVFEIKQTGDDIYVYRGEIALSKASSSGATLAHAVSVNVDADLKPDTFILLKKKGSLLLYLVKQSDFGNTEAWKQFTIPHKETGSPLYLVPSVWVHSLEQLEIVAQSNGVWRSIKSFLPRDFIAPFPITPEDLNTVWMADTGMTRAEAKVLWNFGGRHIGALKHYFSSLWGTPDNSADVIAKTIELMDPNANEVVALSLANRFLRWLHPTEYTKPEA